MHALVCPDKFRGSLTAVEAAGALARGLATAGFEDIRCLPLADGGEGTMEALVAARGGSRRQARVTGPLGDPVDAAWGVLPDGTAVVECAAASGLALVAGQNDPLAATSRGTGELIAAAVRAGARKVLVAVGGSAMTDGGLGAVTALDWSLAGVEVTVACDVETPFLDAAATFGPQKGATPAQVALLQRRLERLAEVYRDRRGTDVTGLRHAGAAGGLAGGLAALGARLEPGFDVVARTCGLEAALAGAGLVVTGEGRLDATSFGGKVVGGVLEWAEAEEIGARVVVAGQIAPGTEVPEDVLALALTDRVWQPEEALSRAAVLLEEAAVEAGHWARERLSG
ncbi:MAG: glycerate kinase family protein [Acidimicrobiia bacterium]